MDKIRIQNLTVFANHGVLPEERVLGQKFLISAELHLDTRAAGMQDDLTRTVNYAQVCSFICQQMQQTFQLIEAAAEHLAQGILREYPLVRRVDLELAKPWAPVHLPVESVSVQISRSWHRAALSMGSNLGDSRAHLDAAVRALQSDSMCRSCRMSDYLVTRPVGYTEQPDFLNGAMVLDTLYTPHELLDNLQRIEQSRHRERVIHWGPRTLDLDLIFYDDQIISDARLQVPHPEAANRFSYSSPSVSWHPTGCIPSCTGRWHSCWRTIRSRYEPDCRSGRCMAHRAWQPYRLSSAAGSASLPTADLRRRGCHGAENL